MQARQEDSRKRSYFSLRAQVFFSLMGAIIYVLKTFVRTPFRIPGHNGILWVIPIIVGVGIVKKLGAATYISSIAGVLISFFGMADSGPFKFFEYLMMGVTIDILAVAFRGEGDNVIAGFIMGAGGNLSKLVVNYSVTILLGIPANVVLAGIGLASVSHFIFGGLGGVSAIIILRSIKKIKGLYPILGSGRLG